MSTLLLALFILSIVVVWISRIFSRKLFLRGRKPRRLADIYAEVHDQISTEIFNMVWLKVGKAFGIDPCLIKPSDTLKALNDIDSWDFGKGQDELSLWIDQENLGKPPVLRTVLDLAKWVQINRTEASAIAEC